MRRAVARGRVFPQSYSTDRRYGRLSLKACALFPLMWANADDQGRLPGEPEEIKYAACPNIDHITKADIPELLEELDKNELIKVYSTSKTKAIQILDWWEVHRPQWAWPSQYPPPEGWQDHLRYKKGAKTVVTDNWFSQVSAQVSNNSVSGERSGETPKTPSYQHPETERRKRKRKEERGRGRGNSPERSGENLASTSPSLTGPSLFQFLVDTHCSGWGIRPNSRVTAQLRDLAEELSRGGGVSPEQVTDAFLEGSTHNCLSVSYIRRILLDWAGIREPP